MLDAAVLEVCVSPDNGGAEHHVLALSTALKASGRTVVVVTAEGGWLATSARSAGVDVETVHRPRGNFDLRTLRDLRDTFRRRGARIVHSHLGRSDWYTWLAVTGIRGVKLVTTEHGISGERPDLFVRGLRRWLHESAHSQRLRRTDAVIAVSETTARTLEDRYRVLRTKSPLVVHPGIEEAGLFEIAARQARGPSQPLRIAVVARLAPEKGLDVALRALSLLLDRGVLASMTIAGSGPEEAGLRGLAESLCIAGAVRFAGHVEDVSGILETSDVFLLSSRSENLPIALLEAMAAGLPVVASAVGGVGEVVTDGVNGLLVRPDDPGAAADALDSLAGDEAWRMDLARAARNRAREYDMRHTTQALGRVYESLA